MLTPNLRILLRGLWRKKFFSVLNIGGLAIGIAASLIIFLLIQYESGIDRFHKKRDRIYRVVSIETFRNGAVDYDGCAPTPLADALRREFPQTGQVAAVWKIGQQQYLLPAGKSGTKGPVKTSNAYYADSSLFNIFDFPWLAGDPRTALQAPYTMAISRSLADSWFGRWQDAMGKELLNSEDHRPFRITGILEDPPSNTDIPLQAVISYETYRIGHIKELADPVNWDNFSTESQCFFLLREGQRIQSMEAGLPHFVATHFTPLFEHSDTRDSCYFQSLKSMHFDSRFDRYGDRGWSRAELWSIGLIGLFLLMVACINFINLSTAQSLNRAKEVGIRKVLGSNRRQLMTGFLWETAVLVAGALLMGIVLAQLALPPLREILGKPVNLDLLHSAPTGFFLLGTGLAVTFLAGFYPGLVLSGFDPVTVFKSKINTRTIGGLSLRRGLLVLQFTIAQLLIMGTGVIVRQMDYFRNRPMGFDRKAIALVDLPGSPAGPANNVLFRNKVLQIPGVLSASLCSDPPSTSGLNQGNFTFENHPHPEDFELVRRAADTAYLSVFHMGLAAGRIPYPSDTIREALLNETAVKRLGFRSPSDILGKSIKMGGMTGPRMTIVGVARDFNNTSLREKINPLMIFPFANDYGTLAVRMEPSAIKETQLRMQKVFAEIYPDHFFNAPFFDDKVVNFYKTEAIQSALFKIFAGLAIFISCLGLYGLVSFMTLQRQKEVGIRKVLGASVSGIVFLFSKEFMGLIGLAFGIATPLGYYWMQEWLSGYQYHMNLGWEVFAVALGFSLGMAWVTVGYKAIRAAISNPVKSLRSE